MNDHVLLHRGDLESARLSRDHADAMRRFVQRKDHVAIDGKKLKLSVLVQDHR